MSAFDSIKNLANKAKGLASQNSDKANSLVDKGGDFIDSRTGGKYADKIDKAQDAAKKQFNPQDAQGGDPNAQQPPQDQNPPQGQ